MKKTVHSFLGLLLLGLTPLAEAQFGVSTNTNGTLTITNYSGPVGPVIIPATINGLMVTGIGAGAFQFNTNITAVTIPGSISIFGITAFLFCTSLTNVTFQEGISMTPLATFLGCSNLISVTIPDSLTNIGTGTFSGCGFTNLTIPDTVTIIGEDAFQTASLRSITIPKTVSSIGTGAFAACGRLTNIILNNANISDYMFEQCTNLSSVAIPGNITNIGDMAFYQCVQLTNVITANGVTTIGNEAFDGCTGLSNLVIPSSVTGIGASAFEGSSLTNILILGSPTIGENAFYQVPSLVSAEIYGGAIGEFAFESCTNLKSIMLGNGVTSIGLDAFTSDPLSSLVIPGSVQSVGENSFQDCMLTNITISYGVKTIGDYAFYGNPISSLYIPGSVTSIGDQAFDDCDHLTSAIIGAGVTNMVTGAFFGCPNLTNVLFLGNAPAVSGSQDGPIFFYSTNVTAYYLPGTTGWGGTYGGIYPNAGAPTALWNPVLQTGDGGFGVSNGQFGFNITGTAGDPVMVLACTNLANPQWTPVQSLTLTNGSAHFTDPAWTNAPARYYGLGFP